MVMAMTDMIRMERMEHGVLVILTGYQALEYCFVLLYWFCYCWLIGDDLIELTDHLMS
jgi:hypothetical protein